jgi:hypothetical protein
VQTIILGATTMGCGRDVTAPTVPAKPTAPGVTLGSLFSCPLTLDAKPYCWGDNRHLGVGTGLGSLAPVTVKGGVNLP